MMGSRAAGSDKLSAVRAWIFTMSSTSVNSVHRPSSSSAGHGLLKGQKGLIGRF